MKFTITRTASAVAIALASTIAQAVVVFDGGDPNGATGYLASAGFVWQSAATKFTLTSDITANQISWWGLYASASNSADDHFLLGIFDGSGATPTDAGFLAQIDLGTGSRVATGNSLFGLPEYLYQSTFADSSLPAGTYFAALTSFNPVLWGWETTSGGSQLGGASYDSSSSSWSADSAENLAFKVSSVPLPAAIWLFGPALAGLTGLGYQRRRQSTV